MTDRTTAQRNPNLFIVGYPKTGTTSIYEFLASHPEIWPSTEKEPGDWQHLSNLIPNTDAHADYRKNFHGSTNERYLMEGSTRYILHPQAATLIKQLSPDAKIIIGLREPLSYLGSFCFQQEKNSGRQRNIKDDLAQNVAYTRISLSDSVERFVKAFGRDSIFFYLFDELQADNNEVGRRILSFLDLTKPVETASFPRKNISIKGKTALHDAVYRHLLHGRVPRLARSWLRSLGIKNYQFITDSLTRKTEYHKLIDPELEQTVKQRFTADVNRLSQLTDKDLPSIWGYPRIR